MKRKQNYQNLKRIKGQTTIYKTLHTKLKTNNNKTVVELRCSGRVSRSCSTSGTCRVILLTEQLISHEIGKDREVRPPSGEYPWSFGTHIFRNG
jgi:hypothetical protein